MTVVLIATQRGSDVLSIPLGGRGGISLAEPRAAA